MANNLKYKTPEELAAKIDAYFESCKGTKLLDEDGIPVLSKWGYPVYEIEPKQPTTCGMAYYLGFSSVQSLFDYKGRPAYRKVMERARLRLQAATEERLFDRDGARGAEFSLRNNFGWKKDPENVNGSGAGAPVIIIDDIPKTSDSGGANGS